MRRLNTNMGELNCRALNEDIDIINILKTWMKIINGGHKYQNPKTYEMMKSKWIFYYSRNRSWIHCG